MPLGTSLVAIEIGVLTGHETSVRDFTAQTRHTGIQVVAAEAAVGEVAVFRKWKWLLVSGCECESEISIVVNLCKDGDSEIRECVGKIVMVQWNNCTPFSVFSFNLCNVRRTLRVEHI